MAQEKPVLIEAAPSAQTEGATFTLQYKNRFLYSKYNPKKNILQAIHSLNLLPGTLVLAFSPCLFYGLEDLRKKCRESSSQFLCVEAEKALYDFSFQVNEEKNIDAPLLPYQKNTAAGLDEFFYNASQKFRRVIRLDLSAGVSFNESFYKNFYECAQNIVAAFWKNRLTLVRLGRLYSKNIFKNLPLAAARPSFEAFEGTVEKPILVCGAGESLDELTAFALEDKKQAQERAAAISQSFFVLAVDAAVPALLAAGIKIDAVAATESQLAIEKAYIGLKAHCGQDQNRGGPVFFFDLTSRAAIARRFARRSAFYFSEFDKNVFLSRLKEKGLLPTIAPPLGSIGLTATYLALRLRKVQDVPVCVLGLDFSFSAGRTHAKGTAQSKALYIGSNRARPFVNFAASYGLGTEKVTEKGGRDFWSSKNLIAYAALFRDYFKGAKNLYDVGKSGLELGLERKSLLEFLEKGAAAGSFGLEKDFGQAQEWPPRSLAFESLASASAGNCESFLRGELTSLQALADLLSKGDGSQFRNKSSSLGEQILQELRGREYLYLHFPDGSAPSLELNFLTRVRSQIDFFCKDIETALAIAAR
ncbi:MAG: 6-hydroxymethylpterin diphosphokinase MptE-like protein [Treponema sp.]|nr:6-hydroxymethylpterin diphosphokinase MptE-like protein [Treponema sp.]MEE3434196.1 6-hydroxymethylpterin diphosphokinase MptE-like protein [Treponema sp.]